MRRPLSAGYTLLETAMLIVVVGTLLRLVVPNYFELRQRAADTTAQRDFIKVKNTLRNLSGDRQYGIVVFMLHQRADEPLPAPLGEVRLENGVRVNYAVRMKFPGYFDLTALEAGHKDGKHLFRLLEINEKGMEQIVRKNLQD